VLSQFARDPGSCTKSFDIEFYLQMKTAAARFTTSGSTSKYPEQYIYKYLDKDIDDIICYVYLDDSPKQQWHIALTQ